MVVRQAGGTPMRATQKMRLGRGNVGAMRRERTLTVSTTTRTATAAAAANTWGNAKSGRGAGSGGIGERADARATVALSAAAAVTTADMMTGVSESGALSGDSIRSSMDAVFDASARPPFSLGDVRRAIPAHLWEKDVTTSMLYFARDLLIIGLLGGAAHALYAHGAMLPLAMKALCWPLYWFAQGTMFWALFCIGHDAGHTSFSKHEWLNNLVGHLSHSPILVPYHPWRISHRAHHGSHGHAENDESWYPMKRHQVEEASALTMAGRLSLPWAMFAYPFYLMKRSPGKEGSHYDPKCDLYKSDRERRMVVASNCWLAGWAAILAAAGATMGLGWLAAVYFVPYVTFVVWLDMVTYLHHHGPEEGDARVPWYRGEEWSYFRGGLSTIDRDYGIFNNIHHDIGTHVVHHLFPQIPHYNLTRATDACKGVMGKYYREPKKARFGIPTHLFSCLAKSFANDKFVEDDGNVLFYKSMDEF